MSDSTLATVNIPSPNYTEVANKKVTHIVIHHMAGNMTVESCGNMFANPSIQASSQYGIGTDGRIAQYVDEKHRAWTTGDYYIDAKAVTMEVANDEGAPNWHVSDKALTSTIKLCADICKRNGIAKLNYTGDKTGNLHKHEWYQNTTCPGPYLGSKFSYIADEVNKILSGSSSTTSPSTSTGTNTGTVTTGSKLHVYKINDVKEVNGIWQLRSNYLVPTDFTWNDNGIPLDDVDFTDANGNKLSNQVWDGTQKYFKFRVGSMTAKTGLTKGSGGYYWVQFESDNGDGTLWLSCDNLNDLYYRSYDNGQ